MTDKVENNSRKLSVADFMRESHKAYAKHGRLADEIETSASASQMFGELIGIWAGSVWQALGSAQSFALVDLSHGDGTIMCDLLRAASTVIGFNLGAQIKMLAASEQAQAAQREKLKPFIEAGFDISWVSDIAEVEAKPSIYIANEYLSALPASQYQKQDGKWRQRAIDDDRNMLLSDDILEEEYLPAGHEEQSEGSVFETSQDREEFCKSLAQRLIESGGVALLIDFGHSSIDCRDSLAANHKGEVVEILCAPQGAKITMDVDFSSLYSVLKASSGATVTPPMEQGEFLVRMGLVDRARQLGSEISSAEQAKLRLDIERIAGEGDGTRSSIGGMGVLHKVMMLGEPKLLPPPFDTGSSDNDPADTKQIKKVH